MATKKKASKRKAVAKKPAKTKQKRSSQTTVPIIRRPDVNEPIDTEVVEYLDRTLSTVKALLERNAAHLRQLDRKRLNGVGVRNQGFIERAYDLSTKDPEFLPHWITLQKFDRDIELFRALRIVFDLNAKIGELVWNLVMQSADMAYTDALEYYASVREAAKRRVDAAESIFEELREFFRAHGRRSGDQPTENEIKRDMNALLKGRKDGKILVENISPKSERGARKLVDKTFKNKLAFKNVEDGEIID